MLYSAKLFLSSTDKILAAWRIYEMQQWIGGIDSYEKKKLTGPVKEKLIYSQSRGFRDV